MEARMYRFNNLLIDLIDEEQDLYLLQYAMKIAKLADSSKIYITKTIEKDLIPDEIRNDYKELVVTKNEIREYIDNSIEGFKELKDFNKYSIEVLEGNHLDEILKFIINNDIDMLITGRKPDVKESATFAEKITRKATCSVMTVPCCIFSDFSKILVPVDFSEPCEYALDVAIAVAKAKNISEIQAVHFYRVPIGFHKTGKSYEEFAEIMKKNSQKEYEKFIKNIDDKGITIRMEFRLDEKIEKGILEMIDEKGTDLIVMASRGRGAGIASLLSTKTERVLSHTTMPLLAVKPKGSGLSIIQTLLEL